MFPETFAVMRMQNNCQVNLKNLTRKVKHLAIKKDLNVISFMFSLGKYIFGLFFSSTLANAVCVPFESGLYHGFRSSTSQLLIFVKPKFNSNCSSFNFVFLDFFFRLGETFLCDSVAGQLP